VTHVQAAAQALSTPGQRVSQHPPGFKDKLTGTMLDLAHIQNNRSGPQTKVYPTPEPTKLTKLGSTAGKVATGTQVAGVLPESVKAATDLVSSFSGSNLPGLRQTGQVAGLVKGALSTAKSTLTAVRDLTGGKSSSNDANPQDHMPTRIGNTIEAIGDTTSIPGFVGGLLNNPVLDKVSTAAPLGGVISSAINAHTAFTNAQNAPTTAEQHRHNLKGIASVLQATGKGFDAVSKIAPNPATAILGGALNATGSVMHTVADNATKYQPHPEEYEMKPLPQRSATMPLLTTPPSISTIAPAVPAPAATPAPPAPVATPAPVDVAPSSPPVSTPAVPVEAEVMHTETLRLGEL
jgi:hypothetical protein